MKIEEKDVSFAEDSFEALKNAVAIESHLIGNYVGTGDKIYLDKLNKARIDRTNLMNIVIETLNADIKYQCWCILKHICCMAMNVHELITRCSNSGNEKIANRLKEIHKNLYLSYLDLLGVNEKNFTDKKTSA